MTGTLGRCALSKELQVLERIWAKGTARLARSRIWSRQQVLEADYVAVWWREAERLTPRQAFLAHAPSLRTFDWV